MIRICLAGFGNMGNVHFERYLKLMKNGEPVKLVAVYDVARTRFDRTMEACSDMKDEIRFYDDFEGMIQAERPDAVDIVLPDHLHCEYTCRAFAAGVHVLCEKPMALSNDETEKMLAAAQGAGKKLMIAHCCRFDAPYRKLKKIVENTELGSPRIASFYRMSGLPGWSEKNWLLNQTTSGGCILDMHIHDVDMLQWVFGKPDAVSALGVNTIPGSGIDSLSAQYRYSDFAACIQSSWSVQGKEVPFMFGYHVEFENGSIFCRDGAVTVYRDGQPPEVNAEENQEDGYYEEIRYFADCLESGREMDECCASESAAAVHLALLERESVQEGGKWLPV